MLCKVKGLSIEKLLVRGRRVSANAAISSQGLVAPELTDSTVDGDVFLGEA